MKIWFILSTSLWNLICNFTYYNYYDNDILSFVPVASNPTKEKIKLCEYHSDCPLPEICCEWKLFPFIPSIFYCCRDQRYRLQPIPLSCD
jgi:hypothetical protein